MATRYEHDIVAWANEQAALLRAGKLAALDLGNLAEEIEDVGKSEQRELAKRMAVLLAHLLKWEFQLERRGASWQRTIREQRRAILERIARTPSLQPMLLDSSWQREIWADAVASAAAETGLHALPDSCPWPPERILDPDFFPDA
jgi:hypothetical protein